MSFLVKGDIGPTNIAEGGVPRDMGITNFDSGLFQAIARAGLEAAGEGSFERKKVKRGSKNRMAGQVDSLTRSMERKPDLSDQITTTREPSGQVTMPGKPSGQEGNFGRGDFQYGGRRTRSRGVVGSKPTPMTKEEYDKMPKRARRKFELAPGMEDLIDRFPTQEDQMRNPKKGKVSRGIRRRGSRDEMRDPNAKPTVYNRGDGSKRLSRDERRDPNAGATIRSTR
jgi:hypothetical protein